MHKTSTPFFVQIIFAQDGHILHAKRIFTIKVNEQSTMVNHKCVVHTVHFFAPIEPRYVNVIVLGLVDFNENPINEPNTIVELENMHIKCSMFLHSKPPDFMA